MNKQSCTKKFNKMYRVDGRMIQVKRMQRSGTEAIRTQIQPSKPKREITNITNSQNTKRTYGQPSEQIFPKRWPLSKINKAFHDKRGNVIERYYGDDLIHLSIQGVKRLLGEINEDINIVEDFEKCAFNCRYQKRGRVQKRSSQSISQNSANVPRRRGKPTQHRDNNTRAACHKCGETNHETIRRRHKEQLKCHACGYFGYKSGRCLNQ